MKFDFDQTGTFGKSAWPVSKRLAEKYKVDKETGCWIWTSATVGNGRGVMRVNGKSVMATRVSYAIHKGSFPDNFVIDHKCRNPRCVNPNHLEPVTQRENVLRGDAFKSHCPQGHPYSGSNLYLTPTGHRQCRECRRVHDKNSKAKRA